MDSTLCPEGCALPTAGFRSPFFIAALALCAWTAPASATEADTTRLPSPAIPSIDSDAYVGADFWTRLREEARRFREFEFGPFTYVRRYSISHDLARMIAEEARREGIDPELGFRLVRVESHFHPRARSYAGALGLTQLMPGTARGIDRRMKTAEAVMEPRANLRVGFRYLRRLLNRYDGDVRLALLAYNRGEGTVDRLRRRGINPENGYSRKVLGARAHGGKPYRGRGILED